MRDDMQIEPRMVAVGRRLTAEQVERRAQLVEAAQVLATQGGYDAVTISAVCERAGVARATFYHYFGSKDHVLGEVLVQWTSDAMDELRQHPPAGRTPLERVVATLRWIMDGVQRDPNLIRAHIQSLASPAGVAETHRQLSSLLADYLEVGLGPSAGFDVASVSMVLKHVFLSSLVNMTAGRTTAEEAMADLTTTAKLLLEPASACGTNRALTGEKRAGGQQRLRRTTRQ